MPETDKLIRLNQIFNCSIDYLLKDEIDENVEEQQTKTIKSKRRFIYCLSETKLISYIKLLIIFITFFLLFATFISLGRVEFAGSQITINYNGFRAISMFTNQSLLTMIAIIFILLIIVILSIFESFYISKAKIFNIFAFIISIFVFINIFFSPNLIILEIGNLTNEPFNNPLTLKSGALFILIFLAIYIILSLINIILYRKKEPKILFKTN